MGGLLVILPLPTSARYAKTEHGGVLGDKPISGLQGLVEASRHPAVRSVLSESLRSGRGFVTLRRSRSRIQRWRVLAKRSEANRPRRRGWHVGGAELNFLIAARNQSEFFAGVRCRTAEPPFFQPRTNDPRRRNHETKTKNAKASRDTFLVIRKGTRVLPSREALLFQKMKKIQKPLKPKKGSKVLCVAEYPGWEKTARINPKIGWVYLVQDTKKVNKGTPNEDVHLILLGQGEQPDARVWCYPSRFFQVVGKGKVIRPRF